MATADDDPDTAPSGDVPPGGARGYGQYLPARLGDPSSFGYLMLTPGAAAAPAMISFVDTHNRRYFNVPVGEVHSVSLADYNATLEFWHADMRHRVCLLPKGLAQAELMAEFTGDTEARHWAQMLGPMVGAPPPGVKVRHPMSKGKRVALNYTLGCLLALVIMIVVVIVMAVTGSR